jgi:hypothetical protein
MPPSEGSLVSRVPEIGMHGLNGGHTHNSRSARVTSRIYQ